MITPAHTQLMSAYNMWQNKSIYGAAAGLSDDQRRQNRGAFFGSIHDTLSHILWGDSIWLSRFTNFPAPQGGIPQSTALYTNWEDLCDAREQADQFILEWAAALEQRDLEGDLSWYSGAVGRDMSERKWMLVTHFFNHQTHHRGQVHVMLTAAGAKPDDTDIPFMPDTFKG